MADERRDGQFGQGQFESMVLPHLDAMVRLARPRRDERHVAEESKMGKVAKSAVAGMTCLVVLVAIDASVPGGIEVVVRSAEASSSTDERPSMTEMTTSFRQMMAQMGGMGGIAIVDKAKTRFPALEVREWNLAVRPELAPRYGAMSTPAIVINGRLEFSKVPGERAFFEGLEALARHDGD